MRFWHVQVLLIQHPILWIVLDTFWLPHVATLELRVSSWDVRWNVENPVASAGYACPLPRILFLAMELDWWSGHLLLPWRNPGAGRRETKERLFSLAQWLPFPQTCVVPFFTEPLPQKRKREWKQSNQWWSFCPQEGKPKWEDGLTWILPGQSWEGHLAEFADGLSAGSGTLAGGRIDQAPKNGWLPFVVGSLHFVF